MHMPFPKVLEVESLARPQLSASDSCVPAYVCEDRVMLRRLATPCRSARQPTDADYTEFKWCQLLAGITEPTALQPYLLDMFGLWEAGQGCYALLCRESDGAKKLKGTQAAQAFYSQPAEGYMVTTKNSWKLVNTHTEARELTGQAVNCFLVLRLTAPVKRIRRFPWRRESKPSGRSPFENLSFQHDLRKFRYAGQLKKSSFSPYMPYRSVLHEKLPELSCSRMEKLLALVLETLEGDRVYVQSLTLHILEDTEGRLFLLNVSQIVWAERERHTLPPVISVPAAPASKPRRSKRGTKESARNLFSRSIVHPPYIDLTDIQRENIRMYSPPLSDRLPATEDFSQPASPLAHTLAEIAKKMDSQRQQCSKLLNPNLKAAVRDACGRLANDNLLGHYFSPDGHSSDQLFLALSSPRNIYLSRRIQQTHKKFSITNLRLKHFTEVFRETLREHRVSEQAEAEVVARLLDYGQDVVCTD